LFPIVEEPSNSIGARFLEKTVDDFINYRRIDCRSMSWLIDELICWGLAWPGISGLEIAILWRLGFWTRQRIGRGFGKWNREHGNRSGARMFGRRTRWERCCGWVAWPVGLRSDSIHFQGLGRRESLESFDVTRPAWDVCIGTDGNAER
jgi:hypothetical protein